MKNNWQEKFEKEFVEGDHNSIHCVKHGIYATPKEIKSFIEATIREERLRIENEIHELGEYYVKFGETKAREFIPYCGDCKESLSGNNSLAFPYECSCGKWKNKRDEDGQPLIGEYELENQLTIEKDMTTKQCTKCKEVKPLTEFYSFKEYFIGECKECKKKRNAEYDKNHIEQKRKRAREYERRKYAKIKLGPSTKEDKKI